MWVYSDLPNVIFQSKTGALGKPEKQSIEKTMT
jgi:hypothetical protein